MYGVATGSPVGFRSIRLGPAGLYASPGWNGTLESPALMGILRQLRKPRTGQFVWTVRFDQEPIAAILASIRIGSRRISTHVLPVSADYGRVAAGYHDTLRGDVRRAERQGVQIRDSEGSNDVERYYRLYEQHAARRGGYDTLYPIRLFEELLHLKQSIGLLLAELQGRLIGGAVFIRDGCSVMYWHAASDRAHSRYHPSAAILDRAIQWACGNGARFVNLGNSMGIPSLERFKESWGARREWNWRFDWENRGWKALKRVGARLRRVSET